MDRIVFSMDSEKASGLLKSVWVFASLSHRVLDSEVKHIYILAYPDYTVRHIHAHVKWLFMFRWYICVWEIE